MSEAMREAFEALRNLSNAIQWEWADEHFDTIEAALSGAQQGEAEPVATLYVREDATHASYALEPLSVLPLGKHNLFTAPQPAQVPEGWMLFPVEAWRFLAGESSLAGVHFGETVNDDKTGRKKPFWWRSHIRHMLTAAPSPDRIAEGGEAVPLAFGSGDYTVEVGRYVDQQAVFIAPARPRGVPGELAPPTTGADRYRLVPGERVMTFPTEAQAFAVAEAIAGRKINRVGGHPVPPSVAVTDDTVYRIGDLGNQIHNLGCSQQNNEELADCLAELAHQAWNLQGELVRERKSAPSDTPSVPENENLSEIPLRPVTHPAQPRNEHEIEFLQSLEGDLLQERMKKNPGGDDLDPIGAAVVIIRQKIARLRTAGDEGGES